jgi:hypothetical protein
MRCHKCVLSTTLGIGETLLNAPSSMLRHWNILRTHDADWEVPLTSLPLLFKSTESYEALKTSFKNSLDRTDDVLHYPYFCSDKQFGEYKFCEAVKVDLSIQRSPQTKEQNYERYVSNSMSLVKVLFEELRTAIVCINDLDHQTMKAKLDQHFTLFNYEKKGTNEGYSFDLQDGIDIELSNKQDESFKTLESWCLFFHWLMNSNRLAVLSQLSKSVYGAPQIILPSLLTRMQFNGDSQYKTHDYLILRATKYPTNGSLLTWSCKLDNGQQYTIQNLHHRPCQFNLGELSTMLTMYDTKGEGWNKVSNIERYFCSDNPRDGNIAQVPITISHQYKENLILLMTVFEIKKIVLGKNMQNFWMRCSMKNYEQGNNAICQRHPTLFKDKKDHYYSFGPSDELVQTLSFEFVTNLNGGAYTRLLLKWMSNI